jgi:MFS family permease
MSGTTTAAARRLPLVALLGANVISLIGNALTVMAIPWFVLVTTGSAGQAGIAVAAGALPVILAGVFGGAVVDRLGYKPASVVADLASGCTTLLIPLLYQTIGLAFWQLLALVFVGALIDAPGESARQSLFPELVARAGLNLERANTGYNATRRVAGLLGPPLAGILIAMLGPSTVLWLDAGSFAISAGIVALAIPTRALAPPATAARGIRQYLHDVADGFHFLRGDRLLLTVVLTFSLGSLLAEPLYAIVLPVYAREVLGSALDLGFIFAALAAGSLVGNAAYAVVGPRLPRRAILLGGFAVRAAAFWVLVTMPSWWVIAGAIFISAVCFEPINPLAMTIFQERVPAGLRARVFGAKLAIGAGSLPLGILAYGFLIERLGLGQMLVVFAILNSALPLAMLVMPGLKAMPRPEAAIAVPVAAPTTR